MAALTRMQQAYAAARARLGSVPGAGLKAAQEARYTGSKETLRVRASKLDKHPAVRAEIARLRGAARNGEAPAAAPGAPSVPRAIETAVLTLHRKLALLSELAEDRNAKDSDRIRAIELASRLDNDLGTGGGGDVELVAAAAARASASATVVVWVGNARGPAPPEPAGG